MGRLPPFDEYDHYLRAVQDPPALADFLWNTHREMSGKEPKILREDFCGAFALCDEWVQRGAEYSAIAVDRAAEPLAYGRSRYLAALDPATRKRLKVIKTDVLKPGLPRADVVAAVNFSYFVFHDRPTLKRYFTQVLRTLNRGGTLVLDVLPGAETTRVMIDEIEHPGFTYFWEQARYNPITRRVLYHIHFQRPGERKRNRVFTYDWRLWTIPELRELLEEVGFGATAVYWEGHAQPGDEDAPEHSESWVAFIVARK